MRTVDRHSFWPYIEGVSERTYTDEQLEAMKPENRPKTEFEGRLYDDYQATQKQRQIERTIRKQKRLKAAYEAAGLDGEAQAANIRLRRLNEKYRAFSKAAGLPEQRERMRVLNERVSIISAPKGNLIQKGEVFHPQEAVDSLIKRLAKSPGMSDNINVIRYYAQNTDFVKDTRIDVPIGYDPSADIIRFNPNIPLPEGVDRDGTLVHELTHRADKIYYNASLNERWAAAIREAEPVMLQYAETIRSRFKKGGEYEENAFLSDIIDAITMGQVDSPYGHPKSYWRQPLNREREVFANLFALDVLFGIDSFLGKKELENIIKVFLEVIEFGGL